MPISKSSSKWIGITLGDPGGIGAEVIAKALASSSIRRLGRFKLIGKWDIYRQYAAKLYSSHEFVHVKSSDPIKFGKVSKANGIASLAYLKKAVELLKNKQIDALITAPVSKEAMVQAEPHFRGHTEFLAEHFGVDHVEMMFVAESMRIVILTRHIPLSKVAKTITQKKIIQTIEVVQTSLKRRFGVRRPRIGICGLNPHAGEGGTLGTEEIRIIIPAIKQAHKKGMDVRGPLSADTLFFPDHLKNYDCVIAMYHDQGLIPIKQLYFRSCVNLTLGLPFIRTSPAHGTAFDIVGQNKADATSMIEAIKLAVHLSKKNRL